MNRKMIAAAAAAFSLALAGCSSSAPAESKASSEASAESTVSTTPEAASFDNIKSALTNAGFTLADETASENDFSATASNDNGSVTVKAGKKVNDDAARADYKNQVDNLLNDGYQQVNTYPGPDREMTLLINDINNVYAIAGVDDTDSEVIVLSDILEANEEASLNAMRTLGYTTTE